jgi:lysine 6-dehydrogenase
MDLLPGQNMPNVIVLGAGRVGAAIARDLAAEPDVRLTSVDASEAALGRLRDTQEGNAIRAVRADLADPAALARLLEGQDLALGALPGPMGFETLRRVLSAGVHAVDISFFEEDPFRLRDLARQQGRVAIVDAGVAPGLSNLILGQHEALLSETTRFECLVGGIPAQPVPPWEYRAPFSPIDVIAEYTRPARFRRRGMDVEAPALAQVEAVELPGAGRLEAFLTDGLRTLLRTSRAPDLVEKTLRWPGHADRIRVLRESGFFDSEPRQVDGRPVVPLHLSTALLFDAWRYQPGETDLTVMRVVVDGRDDEGPVRHTYHLLDRHHAATGVSSMARTTGYTATAIARLVLDGRYREPGVAAPETLGRLGGALEHVLAHLRDRDVTVEHSSIRLEPAPTRAPGATPS